MRSVMFGMMIMLVTVSMALAGVPLGEWGGAITPGIDATGGPDAYGYTWIDSNEPGGPVLSWIDITTTGTLVGGLGDDNWVGPFSTGFPFHYYWYDVEQFYIGSNGYLEFGAPFNMAQPFPATIPLTSPPNDFLAVYVGDWYPGQSGQGSVYYWTNDADSLIVSFIDIPAWSTIGSHYFQVILTDTDSSITYQYGPQNGTVSNTDLLVGIENINGQVGLLHSADTYIPSNYVVRFEYPDNVTYIVHDLATIASANDQSGGFFTLNGESVQPWGKVKNAGNQAESSFQVRCLIESELGIPVYYEYVDAGPLNPGEELEVTFTQSWTPTSDGQYFYTIMANLPGDMNPNNDDVVTEARVMTLPGDMMYDDGSSEQGWTWMGGDGGLGQYFIPPTYPVTIDDIQFYITSGSATLPFEARISDDDGTYGAPGTGLFSQQVNAPTGNQWYSVDVSGQNIEITEGGFYVSWHMTGENSPGIGNDSSATQVGSRRSWEYTGVWAPFRNAETHDVMIRTGISGEAAIYNMTIDIEPVGGLPVIVSPGGSFDWTLQIANRESFTVEFDLWVLVNEALLIFGPATREIPGNMTPGMRTFTQQIPPGAPSNSYTYDGYLGDYETNTIWASDSFPFDIIIPPDGYQGSAQWQVSSFGDWLNENVETTTELPSTFGLNGAHPNPFNPTTVLSYKLQDASRVNLSVFDISGRLVAELVNSWRDAGVHEVTFDASGLTSGVYLYRLTAGEFTDTGKMVLMK
ncbi:hypothetical protein CEE37_05325 [candidate division LCP-89 bacterium B3_LCP]|uniref:Secretion system C-terminal sorting domain-containing protein n=1 Tax=candidate division LCP-89 bacterium B3_LCP TaxID=2012998 RepID=A0A532V1T0_UNCL8|nr:MAG: hypothetical protein CEE37_05325 [candidate division LCP-89 bacterium B3_LCP]